MRLKSEGEKPKLKLPKSIRELKPGLLLKEQDGSSLYMTIKEPGRDVRLIGLGSGVVMAWPCTQGLEIIEPGTELTVLA